MMRSYGPEQRWHGGGQQRVLIPAVLEPQGSDWAAIGERANACLGLECWGPPRWTADQWQALRVVMEMAGK